MRWRRTNRWTDGEAASKFRSSRRKRGDEKESTTFRTRRASFHFSVSWFNFFIGVDKKSHKDGTKAAWIEDASWSNLGDLFSGHSRAEWASAGASSLLRQLHGGRPRQRERQRPGWAEVVSALHHPAAAAGVAHLVAGQIEPVVSQLHHPAATSPSSTSAGPASSGCRRSFDAAFQRTFRTSAAAQFFDARARRQRRQPETSPKLSAAASRPTSGRSPGDTILRKWTRNPFTNSERWSLSGQHKNSFFNVCWSLNRRPLMSVDLVPRRNCVLEKMIDRVLRGHKKYRVL